MNKAWYRQKHTDQDIADDDDDNGFAQFGGYMAAKKAKLVQQVHDAAAERTNIRSTIFQSIAIIVNGHTKPTAEELRGLMAEHSGTFHVYQMPTTTHVIASNLCNVKISKSGTLPIVKPAWIVDSIAVGRLLDYANYLLYTNQSRTQPKLAFHNLTSKKTASDPEFLSEFYANSRLHLIATLGAEFKQLVSEWRANTAHAFIGRARLQACEDDDLDDESEVIMHIDMDCFFVSVSIRDRADLRGRAVAVTHARGQHNDESMAEVACCSYEARACGVRNGMLVGRARHLCTTLVTIPYDFAAYAQVARTLYATIAEYTLDIEAVSCDEMYVDVRPLLTNVRITVRAFAQHIRQMVRMRTGCACSTGFGRNRLLARIATRRAKPDGWFHLRTRMIDAHMRTLPLAALPGVGDATLGKLRALGAHTCGDVRDTITHDALAAQLGAKCARTLIAQVRGEDARPLRYVHERKSVSAEVNYGVRFGNVADAQQFVTRIADEATSRLHDARMKCKCVTLKLMIRAVDASLEAVKFLGHGDCDTMTRSAALSSHTADAATIAERARHLYDALNVHFGDVRGIGVQLTKLENNAPKVNALMQQFLNKTPDGAATQLKQFFPVTRTAQPKTTKTRVKIDVDVLNALPKSIRNEVIEEYGLNEKKIDEESGFDQLDHEQFICMLRNWIRCHKRPLQVDVEMLGGHFEKMAAERRIEKLLIYIRFLHRNIRDVHNGEEWQRAYEAICERLQTSMSSTYGRPLIVP